jgi:glucose-1-phosphate thymidylyltransferase
MKAIIPVAGVGTRLRPHTYTLPKVLLNVAGKPILGHILDALQAHEIDEATIIVGYMGDLVEEYVRKHHTLKVNFMMNLCLSFSVIPFLMWISVLPQIPVSPRSA